jgi:hypothetical protein
VYRVNHSPWFTIGIYPLVQAKQPMCVSSAAVSSINPLLPILLPLYSRRLFLSLQSFSSISPSINSLPLHPVIYLTAIHNSARQAARPRTSTDIWVERNPIIHKSCLAALYIVRIKRTVSIIVAPDLVALNAVGWVTLTDVQSYVLDGSWSVTIPEFVDLCLYLDSRYQP